MFSDPQTVTINAVPYTLARTSSGVNSGIFQKDDGTFKLSVSHTYGRQKVRRLIRLDANKTSTDPYVPANSIPTAMSCYMVVECPLIGYTIAALKQNVDGFVDYLDASSGAQVTKLLGGEN